jgi:small ligand-binding sensory domain FIST
MADETPGFAVAHATGDDWMRLAQACVDELAPNAGTLGFVYVTDALAKRLPSILAFLRERLGIEDWVGSVGMGVCATGHEYFDRPALVAMTARLPAGSWRVFPPIAGAAALDEPATQARFEGLDPGLAVVHGDPRNAQIPAIIELLAARRARYLVGGLTSSRGLHSQVACTVAEGGISGVLFDAAVPVSVGLSQGCRPIGPQHRIGGAAGNIIQELDGEPALTVLQRETDGDPKRLAETLRNIHVALPVAGSDTGDYVVRNLVGIDPERGLIAIGDEAVSGAPLMFVRRDPVSAAADLGRMLDGLKRRATRPPKAGLYFSCIARGANLFGRDDVELGMIRDRLGDFPLAGFFCNGEISHNRLYGYTGVLALFQ